MLTSSIKQFRYYKQLADKAMSKVDDGTLFDLLHDDDNSIAIIIPHLAGNIQTRCTKKITKKGEK